MYWLRDSIIRGELHHPLEPTAKELQHEVCSAVSLMTTTVTKGIEQEQQKTHHERQTERQERWISSVHPREGQSHVYKATTLQAP